MAFFRKFLNDPYRPPAKGLADITLEADTFKPDFEIAERYTSFSTELIRLSLIGMGAFGFVIGNIIMKIVEKYPRSSVIVVFHNQIWIVVAGVLFFTLSLAFALYHRFSSANCLYDQVLILRSLLRLENDHWTGDEKETEKIFLEKMRKRQRKEARLYHHVLMWSAIFLFIGFMFTGIELLLLLLKIGA